MKIEDKVLKLNEKANKIYQDEFLTWEEKYDRIFSEKISRKVFSLIRLDYYDPDTSYEEDVRAFIDAFNDNIKSRN